LKIILDFNSFYAYDGYIMIKEFKRLLENKKNMNKIVHIPEHIIEPEPKGRGME